MLSEKQLLEIREHLEKAQNPVFLYDNDVDGFCSYVLLRKYTGRGKGVAVKSHPDIDKQYAKKVQELRADYVFVLDRPILGKEFVQEMSDLQLPVVWIDHHDMDEEKIDYGNVYIYNPQKGKKSGEPTTYLCYSATKRREDLWVAMIGSIADNYLPEFTPDFIKQYPEHWSKGIEKPFDAYYKTGIGKLIKVISFGLKDSITHVVQLQNFMIEAKGPADVDLALESSKSFAFKYKEIWSKYSALLERAKDCSEEKYVFFNYGGDMSMSSDLSNELMYLHPDKLIVVAYSSGPITNISMRGKNVKKILAEIISNLNGATGGGHEMAVGSRIQTKDLERFKEEFLKKI